MNPSERLNTSDQVRSRLLSILVMLIVGLAVPSLGGCASSSHDFDTIATKQLNLVDEQGVVFARLGKDKDGSAGLFLLDEHGSNRAALIHDTDQTALYLFDGDETIRIGIAQFAHGGGGVALHGEDSHGAAVLYLKNKSGSLTFFDADGNIKQRVPQPMTAPHEEANP